MGSLIVFAIGGLVAWVAIRLGRQREEARVRSWRNAAAEAGLESIQERERFVGRELTGRSGPLSVKLERFKRGKGSTGTRIVIEGLGHEPFGLSLRRENLGTRLDRTLVGEIDIETGDPVFDREVFVSGRPALARAVFGAEARRAVRWLSSGSIPLRDGSSVDADVDVAYNRISVEVTESVFDDLEHPTVSGALLTSLLDAARLLSAPPDPVQAIARHAMSDPCEGVRVACVHHLVESGARHPTARAALVSACDDASAAVRIEAALALSGEGRPTLVAIASAADVDDALRSRAITALGERLPLEVAERIVERRDDAGWRGGVLACVELLGGRGEIAVPALTGALAFGDGEVAVAAARALRHVGSPAEPALVRALGDERPPVRVAAAESLGVVGSVASVPALRDAAERSGADGMARAVRQAVAAIHARLGGADPGQLSLAAGGAGELSLASDARGTVSLVEASLATGAGGLRPSMAPLELEALAGKPGAAPSAPEPGSEEEGAGPRPPQWPGTIQGKT